MHQPQQAQPQRDVVAELRALRLQGSFGPRPQRRLSS